MPLVFLIFLISWLSSHYCIHTSIILHRYTDNLCTCFLCGNIYFPFASFIFCSRLHHERRSLFILPSALAPPSSFSQWLPVCLTVSLCSRPPHDLSLQVTSYVEPLYVVANLFLLAKKNTPRCRHLSFDSHLSIYAAQLYSSLRTQYHATLELSVIGYRRHRLFLARGC